MSALTQERVKGLFDYRDGQLFWKERPRSDFKTDLAYLQWNPKHAGKQAGCYSGKRHGNVAINKKHYNLHRIIFLWHHGYLPEIVDHIDCNPQNNLIENLRAANKAENQRNSGMFSHNTSGYKGVVWSKNAKKWLARIKTNGVTKHLGSFSCKEDAAEFVQLAREMVHGAFANHGLKGA
jgi:HNH endonuclease/AP2 domain